MLNLVLHYICQSAKNCLLKNFSEKLNQLILDMKISHLTGQCAFREFGLQPCTAFVWLIFILC
jgi:hypothetical protein